MKGDVAPGHGLGDQCGVTVAALEHPDAVGNPFPRTGREVVEHPGLVRVDQRLNVVGADDGGAAGVEDRPPLRRVRWTSIEQPFSGENEWPPPSEDEGRRVERPRPVWRVRVLLVGLRPRALSTDGVRNGNLPPLPRARSVVRDPAGAWWGERCREPRLRRRQWMCGLMGQVNTSGSPVAGLTRGVTVISPASAAEVMTSAEMR